MMKSEAPSHHSQQVMLPDFFEPAESVKILDDILDVDNSMQRHVAMLNMSLPSPGTAKGI